MKPSTSPLGSRAPAASRFLGRTATITLLADEVYDEIERFVGSVRGEPSPDTVLATILFTDIVRSTETAVGLGDRAWADLVERHHALVRGHLDRFRGLELTPRATDSSRRSMAGARDSLRRRHHASDA